MKLFLLVYGLVAMVPTGDGMWVLMLDSSGMKYADGTAAHRHFADVHLNTATHGNHILSLVGDDLVFNGIGNGEPEFRNQERFVWVSQVTRDPRIEPACIDESSTCSRDGRPLLAGRVHLKGKVAVAPLAVDPSWTFDTAAAFTTTWGFRRPDSMRPVGIYQGQFASGAAMMIDLAEGDDYTRTILGVQGMDSGELKSGDQENCRSLAKLFETDEAAPCVFVFASNAPKRLYDPMQEAHDVLSRDHAELLFSLLATPQPPLVMYRRVTAYGEEAGSGPGGTCTGFVFTAK